MVERASLDFWKALRMCFLGVRAAVRRREAAVLGVVVCWGCWLMVIVD